MATYNTPIAGQGLVRLRMVMPKKIIRPINIHVLPENTVIIALSSGNSLILVMEQIKLLSKNKTDFNKPNKKPRIITIHSYPVPFQPHPLARSIHPTAVQIKVAKIIRVVRETLYFDKIEFDFTMLYVCFNL